MSGGQDDHLHIYDIKVGTHPRGGGVVVVVGVGGQMSASLMVPMWGTVDA